MPYPRFDRNRLVLRPLAERDHDLDLSIIMPLSADLEFSNDSVDGPLDEPSMQMLDAVAQAIHEARSHGSSVILAMGAHVLRAGVQSFLIEMLRRNWITHVAMNGAGPIHDLEFALVGATTESVARYIRTGEFGLWAETGRLNEVAKAAHRDDLGFGEAVGREIETGHYPHKDVSVLAAAYRYDVPATVHVGIGYDIIHEHANADGAALGAASMTDFLVLAHAVERMESGVLLNFGTAVMGPEVFLKTLSMARNVAHRDGRRIANFSTLVCDLVSLGNHTTHEAPKTDPHYYFRPWKTLLVRTVADGGRAYYVQGDHRRTFPNLYHAVLRHEPQHG